MSLLTDLRTHPHLQEDFWDEVVRDSEQRAQAPLVFAAEVLERLFLYESDKELGLQRWRSAMQTAVWWADDALVCLDRVLRDPPPDFGAWIEAHAGRVLIDQDPSQALHGPALERWLQDMTDRMRLSFQAYLEELRPSRA